MRFNQFMPALLLAIIPLASCSTASRSPYTSNDDIQRDPARSRELLQQATDAMPNSPERAERLVREALAADLYNGAAHNNLGLLLYTRGELYEAASEFQWARRLLPGQPEPRVNLALALEQAGRTSEALAAYDAALEVSKGFLPAIQGRARLMITSGKADHQTLDDLDMITLRGDSNWKAWAGLWRVKVEERIDIQ